MNTDNLTKLAKEFQQAIKTEYGREVTVEDAELILRDLAEYFITLARACKRIDEGK